MKTELSQFGIVGIFMISAILFLGIILFLSRILRPHQPNEEKLSTYESGEEPATSSWLQFNNRFYILGILFILFEVELIFLFPWALTIGRKEYIEGTNGAWLGFALIEIGIFIFILILGLVYAWAKGYLDWIKPNPSSSTFESNIPSDVYEKINKKYE
jgi:NADH-quinone oxidoreductase subunit A